jgi:predicted Fe-Mo cluster-binding NifX family protein
MKVAISTDNNQVSAHFGRCQSYTIYDIEDKEIKGMIVIETPGHQPGMLPGFLHEKGVNTVIAGGMGPRAQQLFTEVNITPIIGITGKLDDVILAFLNDELTSGDSLCTQGSDQHHECHHD